MDLISKVNTKSEEAMEKRGGEANSAEERRMENIMI